MRTTIILKEENHILNISSRFFTTFFRLASHPPHRPSRVHFFLWANAISMLIVLLSQPKVGSPTENCRPKVFPNEKKSRTLQCKIEWELRWLVDWCVSAGLCAPLHVASNSLSPSLSLSVSRFFDSTEKKEKNL